MCALLAWFTFLLLFTSIDYLLSKIEILSSDSHGMCNGFPKPMTSYRFDSFVSIPNTVFLTFAIFASIIYTIFNLAAIKKIISSKKASKRLHFTRRESNLFTFTAVSICYRVLYLLAFFSITTREFASIRAINTIDIFFAINAMFNVTLILVKVIISNVQQPTRKWIFYEVWTSRKVKWKLV